MRTFLLASLALVAAACGNADPACGACTMDAAPGDLGSDASTDAGGLDAGGSDAAGMDATSTDLGADDLGSSDAAQLPDGAACTPGAPATCGAGLSCCSPGGPLAPICMPTCTDPSCFDGCHPVR